MARVFQNDLNPDDSAATALAAAPAHPARDISALGWTLLLLGLATLAGAWVLPVHTGLLVPAATSLVLIGVGLLRRLPWSRPAAMLLFCGLILGQLGRRWLEAELIRPMLDALSGVHEATQAVNTLTSPPPPPLSLAGAVGAALLCVVMGWFFVRLGTHAVRAEFQPPAQDLPDAGESPST